MQSLEDQFLELLKKNEKFRLAVAFYLGYDEILRKLREHDEKFNSILEEIKLLRIETNKLWENQEKLWENQNKLLENQEKLWQEVKLLRENQEKLWENQNKLLEEIKSLREGQNKLWENQEKLWQEVKSLREGQNKLWENQNRLWQEVRSIREGQKSLKEGQDQLWKEVRSLRIEVDTFGRAVGRTLEDYTASFVKIILEERGYPREKINVRKDKINYENKIIEIDVFNEDPLVVGEVTTYLESIEEAKKEVKKVLEDEEVAEKKFNRKVDIKILAVANAPFNVLEELKKLTKENKILFIFRKELVQEI